MDTTHTRKKEERRSTMGGVNEGEKWEWMNFKRRTALLEHWDEGK